MEMKSVCIRKEFENRKLPLDDLTIEALVLLGCSVCKKIDNHEEINKYEKIIIFPLMMSFVKYDKRFFRAIGSVILEDISNLFSTDEVLESDIEDFFIKLNNVVNKSVTLDEFIGEFSESIYCKAMARLHYEAEYEIMFGLAIGYALKHVQISGNGFRINLEYKGVHFFHIGVSLDEGIVETLTQKIFNKEGNPSLSDAYFFEMKLYEKVLSALNLREEEVLREFFSGHGGLNLLFSKTNDSNYCNVYELLSLSDACKWKEANQLLKNWGGTINENR